MDNNIEKMKQIIKEDYDRKIKKFSEISETNQAVIIGDSMVAYLNLKKYGLEKMINFGIAGDTTVGVLNRLDLLIRIKPSKVILNIGSNDIVLTNLSSIETVNHIIKIKDEIESKTDAKVYVISLTPVLRDHKISNMDYVSTRTNHDINEINSNLKMRIPNEEFINIFQELIDHEGNLDIKYTSDGIHLNQQGYEIYTKFIHEILKR